MTASREEGTSERSCGECSLCCVLLRVDELAKPGGTPCPHLGPAGGGCAIHERRPTVCRSYRCLWLQGGLEDEDRPDRLGAIVDLVSTGDSARLSIREARPGAFDASPRLQAIAERFRSTVAVRIADADDPMNPDKPFRVLLPGGEEQHVAGERVRILRPGRPVEERRLPWLERTVRRASLLLARRKWQRLARRPMGVPGERRPDESR